MSNLLAIADRLRSGWSARLELEFARRGQATLLARRRHEGPLRIQRPLYPEGAGVCHAIVLHLPGGIAGGDQLSLDVAVGAGAHALLTTPGATKWYRSEAWTARQALALRVAEQAVAEWLPQESIVFDGAHAEMVNRIDLARGASFIGWEVLCLGRSARGETFGRGLLRMHTEIRREGQPIWLERALIAGGSDLLHSRAGLTGHSVCGTLLAASEKLSPASLQACRAQAGTETPFAVTLLPGLLAARYLGGSAEQARAGFTRIWHTLRASLTQQAPMAPRIWKT